MEATDMSDIILPTERQADSDDPGPMGNWQAQMFVCYRDGDVKRFINLVHKDDGTVYSVLMLPCRNAWGQLMAGWEYAVVYQAPAEIGMEVKT
jgi:hypothetical protein